MADRSADHPFVFVNAIEIPEHQVDTFLEGWLERADFMRRQKGFRDYRMLRALRTGGRFQLINVARWDSAEAFGAATADPEFQKQLQALNDNPDLDVIANPGLYEVALQATAYENGAPPH
jgi:heme oxygenase (mycobilin-producing)